jgi:hypothetical protein
LTSSRDTSKSQSIHEPHPRWLLILLFAAGCGAASADPYPSDWPSLRTGLSQGGCPELAGTYALIPQVAPPFVDRPDSMADRWPFETLTISGDVQKVLKLRFTRSVATMRRWEESLSQDERALVAKLNSRENRQGREFKDLRDDSYRYYISQWVLQPEAIHFLYNVAYACNNGWLTHHYGNSGRRGYPDYGVDKGSGLIRRDNRLIGFGVPAPFVGQIPLVIGSDAKWKRFVSSEPAYTGTAAKPWGSGCLRGCP